MSAFLATLTDDELLRYAVQFAMTDLEKELIARQESLHANPERIPIVEIFKDKVWSIADELSDKDGLRRKAASTSLFNAITQFEDGLV